MNLSVFFELAGSRAIINTDVERFDSKITRELVAYLFYKRPQRLLLIFAKVKNAANVPAWNDNGVTFGNRMAIG